MAGIGVTGSRHSHRGFRCDTWWLHAHNMVRLIFWVDPCHIMYGSIDDTSLLGEQETEIDFGGRSQITASSVIEKSQASLLF